MACNPSSSPGPSSGGPHSGPGSNLVPRACDPWEGNEGSGIIRCRKPGILAKIELRIHFNGQSDSSLKRIIPEPSFPSQGSQARGTRLPWVRLLICVGIPTQRLGRTAYAFLPKNMATAMNARKAYYKKQYILHLQKQIILKLS